MAFMPPGGWGYLWALETQKEKALKSSHIPIYDVGVWQGFCNQTMPQKMGDFFQGCANICISNICANLEAKNAILGFTK